MCMGAWCVCMFTYMWRPVYVCTCRCIYTCVCMFIKAQGRSWESSWISLHLIHWIQSLPILTSLARQLALGIFAFWALELQAGLQAHPAFTWLLGSGTPALLLVACAESPVFNQWAIAPAQQWDFRCEERREIVKKVAGLWVCVFSAPESGEVFRTAWKYFWWTDRGKSSNQAVSLFLFFKK